MRKNIHQGVRGLGKKRQFKALLVGLIGVLFSFSVLAEMRIWEDKSGKRFSAEFVREISGRITLKMPDNRPLFIKVEDLSASDLQYIRTTILPEIQIEVRKKKKAKERNTEFVGSSDFVNVVTLDVTVKKKTRTLYEGRLNAEVYLVGKEVATDDYVLFGKKTFPVRFTEENRGACEFSTSADVRHFLDYNDQYRGATYEGYLVVVLDSQKKRLDAKTNLSWLEDENIEALRALRVDSFFRENCKKRSVPRPAYYQDRANW